MIHNGVSSKSPYYLKAIETDIRLHGQAFIWKPNGSQESWLIPPEWIVRIAGKKSGRTIRWEIVQDGAIGGRLISMPADEICMISTLTKESEGGGDSEDNRGSTTEPVQEGS